MSASSGTRSAKSGGCTQTRHSNGDELVNREGCLLVALSCFNAGSAKHREFVRMHHHTTWQIRRSKKDASACHLPGLDLA